MLARLTRPQVRTLLLLSLSKAAAPPLTAEMEKEDQRLLTMAFPALRQRTPQWRCAHKVPGVHTLQPRNTVTGEGQGRGPWNRVTFPVFSERESQPPWILEAPLEPASSGKARGTTEVEEGRYKGPGLKACKGRSPGQHQPPG